MPLIQTLQSGFKSKWSSKQISASVAVSTNSKLFIKESVMTKGEIDFIKTVNWIEENLRTELRRGEIEDTKKRLLELQLELRKALKDLQDSY